MLPWSLLPTTPMDLKDIHIITTWVHEKPLSLTNHCHFCALLILSTSHPQPPFFLKKGLVSSEFRNLYWFVVLISGRCYSEASCRDSWDVKKGGETPGKYSVRGISFLVSGLFCPHNTWISLSLYVSAWHSKSRAH